MMHRISCHVRTKYTVFWFHSAARRTRVANRQLRSVRSPPQPVLRYSYDCGVEVEVSYPVNSNLLLYSCKSLLCNLPAEEAARPAAGPSEKDNRSWANFSLF
jgi:hypothetical protein